MNGPDDNEIRLKVTMDYSDLPQSARGAEAEVKRFESNVTQSGQRTAKSAFQDFPAEARKSTQAANKSIAEEYGISAAIIRRNNAEVAQSLPAETRKAAQAATNEVRRFTDEQKRAIGDLNRESERMAEEAARGDFRRYNTRTKNDEAAIRKRQREDEADLRFRNQQEEKNFQYLQRLRLNSRKMEEDAAKKAAAESERAAKAGIRDAENLARAQLQAFSQVRKAAQEETGGINPLARTIISRFAPGGGIASSGANEVQRLSGDVKAAQNVLRNADPEFVRFLQHFRSLPTEAEKSALAAEHFGADVSKLMPQLTSAASALGGAEEAAGGLAGGLGGLLLPFALVAAAIAGVVLVVGALGVALYGLTKSGAETAAQYHELSVEVGYSAHTLSALDAAAASSGVSFQQVGAALGIFDKKLEGASEKSSKLGRVLKDSDVDVRNNQKALEGMFNILSRLPDGETKTALAMEAFGRGGKAFLAIIKEAHGDLPAFIARLDQMGATLSDKDAEAAHEFKAKLELLGKQFDVAKVQVAEELMPVFSQFLSSLSRWLIDNHGQVKEWGVAARDAAVAARNWATDLWPVGKALAAAFTPLASLLALMGRFPSQAGVVVRAFTPILGVVDGLRAFGRWAGRASPSDGTPYQGGEGMGPHGKSTLDVTNDTGFARHVSDLMGESTKHTRKAKTEAETLSGEYKKLAADLKSLRDTMSAEYKLRFEVEDLKRLKADLERVLSLRHELSMPLSAVLPANADDAQREVERLERVKGIVGEVRKLQLAQEEAENKLAVAAVSAGVKVVDAYTRAETAYLDGVRSRRDAEQQLTADLSIEIRKRSELAARNADEFNRTEAEAALDRMRQIDQARAAAVRAVADMALANSQDPVAQARNNPALAQGMALARQLTSPRTPVTDRLDRANEILKLIETNTREMGGHGGTVGGRAIMSGADTSAQGGGHLLRSSKDLEPLVRMMGFKPGAGYDPTGRHHNRGSLHYVDRALDVPTAGHNAEEVEALMSFFRSGGVHVLDERKRPKGQKVWGGSNIHLSLPQDVLWGGASAPQAPSQAEAPPADFLGGLWSTIKGYAGTAWDAMSRTAAQGQGAAGRQGGSAAAQPNNPFNLDPQTYQVYADIIGHAVQTTEELTAATDILNTRTKAAGEAALEEARVTAEARAENISQVVLTAQKMDELANRRRVEVTNVIEMAAARRQLNDLSDPGSYETRAVLSDAALSRLRAQVDLTRELVVLKAEEQTGFSEAEASGAREAERDLLRQRQGYAQEAGRLQYQIAHANDTAAERSRVVWLSSIRDIQKADEDAADSMITSAARIADQQVYHAGRAHARVLDFLAQQKGITDIVADANIGVIQLTYDLIDSGLDRALRRLGPLGGVLKQVIGDLGRLAANWFFRQLVGGGSGGGGGFSIGGGQSQGSGGGVFSQLAGGIFRGLTGGFSGGSAGSIIAGSQAGGASGAIPNFLGVPGGSQVNLGGSIFQAIGGGLFPLGQQNFSEGVGSNALSVGVDTLTGQSAQRNALSQILKGGASGAGSAAAGTVGLGAGIAGALAPLAPILGLTLGSGLGGRSTLGRILGGVGGGIIGGVAGISLAAYATSGAILGNSLIAGLVPFLFNPATLIAAPLLLLGAVLLGRAKQRKEDEKKRDALFTGTNGVVTQVNQLIADVKAHRRDGADAVQNALSLRSQYYDAVMQIKTKSVRNSALNNQLPVVDQRIAVLRQAANDYYTEVGRDKNLVPEFPTGIFEGVVPGAVGSPQLIIAHGGERVLTIAQQRQYGVGQSTIVTGAAERSGGNSSAPLEVTFYITNEMGRETRDRIFIESATSSTGQKVIARIVDQAQTNKEVGNG